MNFHLSILDRLAGTGPIEKHRGITWRFDEERPSHLIVLTFMLPLLKSLVCVALATAALVDAYSQESAWREGVCAALCRLLMLIDEEPVLARLWVVEASAAGHQLSRRRAEILAALAVVIDRGRATANARGRPPQLSAELKKAQCTCLPPSTNRLAPLM